MELGQFFGTQNYYRWNQMLHKHLLTDGCHYVANEAKAYWLFDSIAYAAIGNAEVKKAYQQQRILFWELKLKPDGSAVLEARLDSDQPILYKEEIVWTDFPEDIRIWVNYNGDSYVYMLPSEY